MINILPFLEKHFNKDEPIILACSTGPDSMFLLYEILKTPYKENLVACYFNHKLRAEADIEEKFLKDLGKEKGFKVEVGEWGNSHTSPLTPLPKREGKSGGIEEKARIARYEFFDKVLKKYGSDKIILAHHLDDKIETFFFNLVRGTKLTGLINMTENPPSPLYQGGTKDFPLDKGGRGIFLSPSPFGRGLGGGLRKTLRPLLNFQKKDIQKYLDENGLKYFVDNSNFDTKITRNKLRLEILPKFEEINNNYKENIANLMNYLEEVKENIDEEVKGFLSLNLKNPPSPLYQGGTKNFPLDKGGLRGVFEISAFNELSPFMQKEVIRYIYFISNGNSTIGLSEANIEEIIRFINGKNNKTIKEIGGLKMKKENKVIVY